MHLVGRFAIDGLFVGPENYRPLDDAVISAAAGA